MNREIRYLVALSAAAFVWSAIMIFCAIIDREEFKKLWEVWREDAPLRAFAHEYAEESQ